MHVCIEEISRGDSGLGGVLDAGISLVAQELFVFGTEEQKQKWLVPVLQGKEIGAFALTEPDAGSDAGCLKTSAVLQGDAWVLNGTKQFISNAGLDISSVALVAAQAGDNGDGRRNIAAFVVPVDTPGCVVGNKYDKMAWSTTDTRPLILEDCRIPKENVLGDPVRGFAQHLAVLETGRITIGAVCVGVAQACLDEALRYAKDRVQFGRPIFNFQATQFKLVDMAVSIEMARNLYLKAAWLKDQGRKHSFEASATKLFASEMLERVASDAVQIHGGYGYMNEYPVSRYYKSAKLLQILEGTSEVQRMIIGRMLAKMP
jgi:alkylation response protein AidB-like acyl-CoA dehydrogenase